MLGLQKQKKNPSTKQTQKQMFSHLSFEVTLVKLAEVLHRMNVHNNNNNNNNIKTKNNLKSCQDSFVIIN